MDQACKSSDADGVIMGCTLFGFGKVPAWWCMLWPRRCSLLSEPMTECSCAGTEYRRSISHMLLEGLAFRWAPGRIGPRIGILFHAAPNFRVDIVS